MTEARSLLLTYAQLFISPDNVRQAPIATEDLDKLAASIDAHGLLLPLAAHPGPEPDRHGVFAGGRRLRAIGRLIETGRRAADEPIPVLVRDLTQLQIVELSLTENIRRDLEPWEVFAAYSRMIELGSTIEQIAASCDQPAIEVERYLRLGHLAPPIFAALAEGRLKLELAQAYAAVEDHGVQRAAWEACRRLAAHEHTPERIRAAMKVGDREAEKLLRFVGMDAYRAADGRFTHDLFASLAEERGRVEDGEILLGLANAKLDAWRDRVRAAAGRPLRFGKPPESSAGYPDYGLQIATQTLRDASVTIAPIPDGDVIASLDVMGSGAVELGLWWASRKARTEAARPVRHSPIPASAREPAPAPAPTPASQGLIATGGDALRDPEHYLAPANAAAKEEYGATADFLEAAKSIRREMLRAVLVQDAGGGGTIARDYLVWALLRQRLSSATGTGMVGLHATPAIGATDTRDKVAPLVDATPAHDVWQEAVDRLGRQRFVRDEDLEAAFAAYRASGEEIKALAAAVVAGLALERTCNAHGFRCALHDVLAGTLRPKLRGWRTLWRPSARMFAMLPRQQLLGIVQRFVTPSWYRALEREKSAELATRVVEALSPRAVDAAREPGRSAREWVHPLLRFAGPGEAVDDDERVISLDEPTSRRADEPTSRRRRSYDSPGPIQSARRLAPHGSAVA